MSRILHMTIQNWVTGVTVPILAVFFGGVLTVVMNRYQAKRDTVTERGMILLAMQYDLKYILSTPQDSGKYPSLQFYTGDRLLKSSAFDMVRHRALIELSMSIIIEFDRFDLGLRALPSIWGPFLGQVSNPTIGNIARFAIERTLGNEHVIDQAQKEMQKRTKEIIDTNMLKIRSVATELLDVVSATLSSKGYILQKRTQD